MYCNSACTHSVQGLSSGVFSGPEVAGVVAFRAEGLLILKFGVSMIRARI